MESRAVVMIGARFDFSGVKSALEARSATHGRLTSRDRRRLNSEDAGVGHVVCKFGTSVSLSGTVRLHVNCPATNLRPGAAQLRMCKLPGGAGPRGQVETK